MSQLQWVRGVEHSFKMTFKAHGTDVRMVVDIPMCEDRDAVEWDLVNRLQAWPHPNCFRGDDWTECDESWREQAWGVLCQKGLAS